MVVEVVISGRRFKVTLGDDDLRPLKVQEWCDARDKKPKGWSALWVHTKPNKSHSEFMAMEALDFATKSANDARVKAGLKEITAPPLPFDIYDPDYKVRKADHLRISHKTET